MSLKKIEISPQGDLLVPLRFGIEKFIFGYENRRVSDSVEFPPNYICEVEAPEITKGQKRNKAADCKAADWWRLGCILYIMLTGFVRQKKKMNQNHQRIKKYFQNKKL